MNKNSSLEFFPYLRQTSGLKQLPSYQVALSKLEKFSQWSSFNLEFIRCRSPFTERRSDWISIWIPSDGFFLMVSFDWDLVTYRKSLTSHSLLPKPAALQQAHKPLQSQPLSAWKNSIEVIAKETGELSNEMLSIRKMLSNTFPPATAAEEQQKRLQSHFRTHRGAWRIHFFTLIFKVWTSNTRSIKRADYGCNDYSVI